MIISIYFGKAIKHKISNYPWLTCEKEYSDIKTWSRDVDDSNQFVIWLKNRYFSEVIDRRNFYYQNKRVVVVSFGGLDEFEFFFDNGELAKALMNDKLDELFKEFEESEVL